MIGNALVSINNMDSKAFLSKIDMNAFVYKIDTVSKAYGGSLPFFHFNITRHHRFAKCRPSTWYASYWKLRIPDNYSWQLRPSP